MANFNCRVSGVLLDNQDSVLLIKRNDKYAAESQNINEHIGWEFCGGGIEYGETPVQALEREYKEETGLQISAKEIFHVRTGFRNEQPLLVLSYLCRYKSGNISLTEEHSDFQWVSIETLKGFDLGPYTNLDKDVFIKFYAGGAND